MLSYHIKFINVLDTHVYFICLSHSGGAKIFVWGRGNIRQNFIHEFLSSPVLQWRRQNFGSEKAFSENVLIKDFFKIFEKFIKQFAQNFKKFSKFFKNKI